MSARFPKLLALVVTLAVLVTLIPAVQPTSAAQGSAAAICRTESDDVQCGIPTCLTPDSALILADDPSVSFVACERQCGFNEERNPFGRCQSMCEWPFVPIDSGGCSEVLDAAHPCVAAGAVPAAVVSNLQLAAWVYLDGSDECVTHAEYQQRILALREVSAAEESALGQLSELTGQLAEVEAELVGLAKDLAGARDMQRKAQTEAVAMLAAWEESSADVVVLRGQIEAERDRFRDFAISSYMDGNALRGPASSASMSSVQAVGVFTDYAGSVLDSQAELIGSVAGLEREAAERKALLAESSIDAVQIVSGLHEYQLVIDASIARVEQKQAEQVALWEQANKIAQELSVDREEGESSVGVLQASSDEIEALLVSSQARALSPSQFDGSLFIPLEGLINSSFGIRIHPFLKVDDFHRGVDIDSGFGEPIHAAIAGTVVIAGERVGYGNTVAIDHGAGLSTLYAHQEAVAVTVGQVVAKGDIVGYTGSTGYSTGPHLHFEIRVSGVPVDPAPYLNTIGR